jgi:hypothetical protein
MAYTYAIPLAWYLQVKWLENKLDGNGFFFKAFICSFAS